MQRKESEMSIGQGSLRLAVRCASATSARTGEIEWSKHDGVRSEWWASPHALSQSRKGVSWQRCCSHARARASAKKGHTVG